MTLKKQEVLDLVASMPDEFDSEDIMYRLYVLDKIREGEADVKAGKVISSEELKKEIKNW